MSIFKSTFPEGVKKQLETRQEALSKRTSNSVQYFGARTAWIKMTSAVNVGEDNGTLAKNNVLLGGALYEGKLRSGVGIGASNAYSLNTAGGTQHRLGIRPMPGITGIEVQSKSAYGSLRQVDVSFVCWDIKQLEELEVLYMRPGYSVLVEWGWIPYLNNRGELKSDITFTKEVEEGKGPKEEIWKNIFTRASETGNYDAVYGFVKNYSWSARPDGGYDCTTSIITMGEIIESLKVNYTNSEIDISKQKGIFGILDQNDFASNQPIGKSYQKSYLAGIINEIYEIANKNFDDRTNTPITLGGIECNFFYFKIIKQTTGDVDKDNFVNNDKQIYFRLKDFINIFNKYVTLKDTEAPVDASGARPPIAGVSLKDKDDKDLLCLGNIHQTSTDPFVCQIKNLAYSKNVFKLTGTGAENIKKITDGLGDGYFLGDDYEDKQLGIIGNIYVNLGYLYNLITDDELAAQDKKEKRNIGLYDFLKNIMSGINTAIGNVANFDIHVDPYDSKARIIDINYVDEVGRSEAYNNAFLLEMHNLKSTVRSYKLESKIFPEQAAIVSVGSQVEGGAMGQGDNTLIDFNQNLIDRIIKKKGVDDITNPPSDSEERAREKAKNLKTNLSTILEYFTALSTSEQSTINTITFGLFGDAGVSFDTSKSSAYSGALRDIIAYYKSIVKDNNNNRAIIPTTLSIEMDGIGGIIIGNLFKIPLDLLPKGYKNAEQGGTGAKIGYVVMRMGHSVTDNDWITKLEAQFIILDEPKGKLSVAQYLEVLVGDLIKAEATTVISSPAGSSTSIFASPIIGNTTTTSGTPSVTPIKNSGDGSVAENSQKYPVLVKNETWKKEYNSTVQKYAKVSASTPVADSLRRQLDKFYVTEKGNELSSNGDITEALKSAVLTFQSKLKSTAGFDFIKSKPIRITAGNDTYHRTYGDKRNRTTHCRGLAIDIGTREFTQSQIDSIMNLLRKSGFTYVIYHGGSALHIHANISTT
jgi:hypothetical protein